MFVKRPGGRNGQAAARVTRQAVRGCQSALLRLRGPTSLGFSMCASSRSLRRADRPLFVESRRSRAITVESSGRLFRMSLVLPACSADP
jgi:hypothetical protein